MSKIKKLAIISSVAAAVLIIGFFGSKILIRSSFRNHIPAIPDDGSVTDVIRQQLSEATQKAIGHPNADNLGRLGMAYHSSAYYDQARQCYQLAAGSDKSGWIWDYYLGYLGQEMGDSKSAIESFSKVVKKNSRVISAWYYLGEAYRNAGEEDNAKDAFAKIADLPSVNSGYKPLRANYSSFPVSARFELARIALDRHHTDEAENLLKAVLKTDKTIGPVFRLLGNVYKAKGDSMASRQFNERAGDLAEITTLNDTLIDRLALISRSELYLPKQIDDALKSANPEWALQLFNQALKYIPDNKYVVSKAIKFYCRMNLGKQALPYLDKDLRDFSTDFGEMKDVGYLLSRKGFFAESIPFYVQAGKLQPDSLAMAGNFALSYWKNNQRDSALALMANLYANNKRNSDVLASEVNFMLGTGNLNEAKVFLDRLKTVSPSDPKIPKFAGRLAEMEGKQEEAVKLFEIAFKKDTSDLEIAQKLNFWYTGHEMWNKAETVLKTSLKYHPNESSLQEKLGTLLISCPDPKVRDIETGLNIAERAFYNVSSSLTTVTSAGKDLVIGNAMKQDFKTAAFYMNITLNIANNQKMPQAYIQGLIQLSESLKFMSKQP